LKDVCLRESSYTEDLTRPLNALNNFIRAHKHERKLDRCIGISFVRDDEHRLINWIAIDEVWAPDSEMGRWLANYNPLPAVREVSIPRYSLKSNL
jgi:hypothetical protein